MNKALVTNGIQVSVETVFQKNYSNAFENISSIEIESRLYKHPAVALAAVVAKPDPKWGEVPCAFVELKTGESVDEAALIAFCRESLAGFKTPKKIVFGELPKTSTGKIQKFLLREQAKGL